MTDKEKEELFYKFSSENVFMKTLIIIYMVSFLLFISSFFVWIWHSWDLAWKLGLSALIVLIITTRLYLVLKERIKEVFEEE